MEVLLATGNAELPPGSFNQDPVFLASFADGNIFPGIDHLDIGCRWYLFGGSPDNTGAAVTLFGSLYQAPSTTGGHVGTIFKDRLEQADLRGHRSVVRLGISSSALSDGKRDRNLANVVCVRHPSEILNTQNLTCFDH